jgi:hypothetical protein
MWKSAWHRPEASILTVDLPVPRPGNWPVFDDEWLPELSCDCGFHVSSDLSGLSAGLTRTRASMAQAPPAIARWGARPLHPAGEAERAARYR